MKKYLSLLFASLMVFSMFVAPGNVVKAAGLDIQNYGQSTEDCGCSEHVTPILGAAKNKIVSDLISSKEFNTLKHDLLDQGYNWNGVSGFEVVRYNVSGTVGIMFPLMNANGSIDLFFFMNSIYVGFPVPLDKFNN